MKETLEELTDTQLALYAIWCMLEDEPTDGLIEELRRRMTEWPN